MTHEGETARGPEAILTKLKAMAQMNSTFGRAVYETTHIDAQALGAVSLPPLRLPFCLPCLVSGGPLPSPLPPQHSQHSLPVCMGSEA